MTKQQNAVLEVLKAILGTIIDMGPQGCPEGPLYAGLMTAGCSLGQFQSITGILIRTGKVRREGHVLYAV